MNFTSAGVNDTFERSEAAVALIARLASPGAPG
jgi:hypothetical protein